MKWILFQEPMTSVYQQIERNLSESTKRSPESEVKDQKRTGL